MKNFLLISVGIAVLDQLTKQMIVRNLDHCEFGFCDSIELLPFLKLILVYNDGAAFSILSDAGGWQRWFLSLVSFSVSGFIFLDIQIETFGASARFCLSYNIRGCHWKSYRQGSARTCC